MLYSIAEYTAYHSLYIYNIIYIHIAQPCSYKECAARRDVMLDHYVGTVEIEVKCMIQMLNQHVIPSVKKAGVGPSVESLDDAVGLLNKAMDVIHHEGDLKKKADMARIIAFPPQEGTIARTI